MRTIDWSSDVCSSDLVGIHLIAVAVDLFRMLAHPLAQDIALGLHGIAPRFEKLALTAQGFGGERPVSGRQRCELRRFGDASQTTELGVQDRKSTRLNSSH